LRLSAWLKIAIVAGLMSWLFYASNLRRLWDKTNPFYGEPNWGHAIFVPIVGLYYLYLNRDELLTAKVNPLTGMNFGRWRFITSGIVLACGVLAYLLIPRVAPVSIIEYGTSAAIGVAALGLLAMALDWGLGSLVFGLLIFGYGIYPGQNDWLKDLGMVVTLFGVVLTLCGWDVMRITWFPILFLVCALPWPGLVYSKIAGPLQNLAAWVSVGALNLFGVESSQQGTKIVMSRGIMVPPRILNVAEACAGLKALMTFLSLGATVAFLSSRPLWQKIIITLSAIPIAIFCNVMRVAGQGLLDYYVSEQLSQSFAHQMVGLVMMLPAFLLILLMAWLVDQIFIEEVETPSASAPPRSSGKLATASGAIATAPRRQKLASTTPAEGRG
jgi:exosortase